MCSPSAAPLCGFVDQPCSAGVIVDHVIFPTPLYLDLHMPVDEQMYSFVVLVVVKRSGTVDGEQLHLSAVVVASLLGFAIPRDEQLYFSVVLVVVGQGSGAIDSEQLYLFVVAVVSLQDLGELHDEQLHHVVFVCLHWCLDWNPSDVEEVLFLSPVVSYPYVFASVVLLEKHGTTQRITLTLAFSKS